MKTLFIMRHAKSSWEDASLADFERPLNERGLRTAPFMGKLMSERGLVPLIALSSPAERAKQTALIVKEAGSFSCEIRFDDRIYEASPHSLVQVVAETDDAHTSAIIVGHNPGIEGFIRFLTGVLEPMPTSAIAVVGLNIEKWGDIGDGCGELRKIFRPKDLITA